jgi:5-methylcytosine-specific restriction endonuclease McrA
MQKHTKTYLDYFKPHNGFIACEVCGKKANDLHHIKRRSEFGSKTKDEQDKIENLIALCRECHEKAHAGKLTKEYLSKRHETNSKSITQNS